MGPPAVRLTVELAAHGSPLAPLQISRKGTPRSIVSSPVSLGRSGSTP